MDTFYTHFRVLVMLIVKDCDCEKMYNRNKSAVPLL